MIGFECYKRMSKTNVHFANFISDVYKNDSESDKNEGKKHARNVHTAIARRALFFGREKYILFDNKGK